MHSFIISLLTVCVLLNPWQGDAQAPDAAVEPPIESTNQVQPSRPPSPVKSLRSRTHRTYRGDLVAIGNDAVLKEGDTVRQVVVVGGSVVLNGKVNEDVVVILGRVRIGPKAEVRRNLTVVGGSADVDPGATVGHTRMVLGGADTGFANAAWLRWPSQWLNSGLMYARPLPHQYAWGWLVAGVALLLYLLVAVLFPRQVQAAVTSLEQRPGNAWFTGFLAMLLAGPFVVLLAITVIGLVAIPFVLAAFLLAFLFGRVAVYRYAGQQLGAQIGSTLLQQPLVALLAGALLFCLVYTVPVLGFIVWAIIAPLGVGAVLLAVLRRPPKVARRSEQSTAPEAASAESGTQRAAAAGGLSLLLPRAGFWLRFMACLLDLLLVGAVVSTVIDRPRWFLLVWVTYHLVFWAVRGTTLGGMVFGLRVVRLDGERMNFGVALVRIFGSFLSAAALGLGFLWAGWSYDKQSWHDKIAGTVVVKAPGWSPAF